jgi:hypothetical protein
MQDEISRMPDEQEETAQKGVLGLLLALDSQRPWSVAEVERELGEHISTVDAVASLHAAGLVHRCGRVGVGCAGSLGIDQLGLLNDPACRHSQGLRTTLQVVGRARLSLAEPEPELKDFGRSGGFVVNRWCERTKLEHKISRARRAVPHA